MLNTCKSNGVLMTEGVLNTCKSNGVLMTEFSDNGLSYLVADG